MIATKAELVKPYQQMSSANRGLVSLVHSLPLLPQGCPGNSACL